MKYIFGPVNSRRLGFSLGIDLMPHKTCSLDCVYCECGKTTSLTTVVSEYVPVDAVISELDVFLSASPRLDSLTFSGSGEPTLHSGIGKIISHLKNKYPQYRVTVLTNGTLLWREDVRNSLLEADCVISSLDAVSDDVFSEMLRPAAGITPELLREGIIKFAHEYKGMFLIEVFILPGLNDNESELEKIKGICLKAAPAAIQLNSLDRPGSEKWVRRLSLERLLEIKKFFAPLNTTIPSREAIETHDSSVFSVLKETIARRPCTAKELAAYTGAGLDFVKKELGDMVSLGTVKVEKIESEEFFSLNHS
ncbi:MAG: radical SAM protein [Leptospirales bacterium]|nr:radical SAM protein [Leptospirales bacterium]